MTRATATFIVAPLVLLAVLGVVFYAFERSSNSRVQRLGPIAIVLAGMIASVVALLPHAKLAGSSPVEIAFQVALPPAGVAAVFLLEGRWLARSLAKRLGGRIAFYLTAYVVLGGLLWAVTAWFGVLAMMFIGF